MVLILPISVSAESLYQNWLPVFDGANQVSETEGFFYKIDNLDSIKTYDFKGSLITNRALWNSRNTKYKVFNFPNSTKIVFLYWTRKINGTTTTNGIVRIDGTTWVVTTLLSDGCSSSNSSSTFIFAVNDGKLYFRQLNCNSNKALRSIDVANPTWFVNDV